jgi:hypothetical protein
MKTTLTIPTLCFNLLFPLQIKSMKPTVDSGPPREHPFSNKREIEKLRYTSVIEMENRLMLERLAKVVQHKSIDNEIHKSVAMHAAFKKKLGMTKKRLHMQKITRENQHLLKRIQEVPPAYNHLEWEEEARRRDEVMRNMTVYPEILEKREKEAAEAKKSLKQSKKNNLKLLQG